MPQLFDPLIWAAWLLGKALTEGERLPGEGMQICGQPALGAW
jgi:hypothetical protein